MYFDDLPKGYTFETGTRTLGEDDILAFARQWDPQDFHTDPEAAKASPYGGLIASGFHSMLTAFNLILDANVWNEASMGSPGIEGIRFLRPVRPGDTLHARVEVIEKRESRSRPEMGLVTMDNLVENQDGVLCCTWRGIQLIRRRAAT